MTDRRAVLAETLAALQQAAARLEAAHLGVGPHSALRPDALAALPQPEQERLDAGAIRYARCQDLLFPSMRALGWAQLEPKADGSFLELHALMQKQGIVSNARDWERQRALRNAVGHAYPGPAPMVGILNGIPVAAPQVLAIAQRLAPAAEDLTDQAG